MRRTVILDPSAISGQTSVIFNLPGEGTDRGAGRVSGTATLAEMGVNPTAQAAPVWPQADIDAVNANARLSGEQKQTQIEAVVARFKTATTQYRNQGGLRIEDRVLSASHEYLKREHNYTGARTTLMCELHMLREGVAVFEVGRAAVWGR